MTVYGLHFICKYSVFWRWVRLLTYIRSITTTFSSEVVTGTHKALKLHAKLKPAWFSSDYSRAASECGMRKGRIARHHNAPRPGPDPGLSREPGEILILSIKSQSKIDERWLEGYIVNTRLYYSSDNLRHLLLIRLLLLSPELRTVRCSA